MATKRFIIEEEKQPAYDCRYIGLGENCHLHSGLTEHCHTQMGCVGKCKDYRKKKIKTK